MKDIKLNNELVFENGDFVLVDKVDRILQQIKVALYTLPNDWFLDWRKGIDYGGLLKALMDSVLKAKIKKAVREVDGVEQITLFDFSRKGVIISVKIGVQIEDQEYTIIEGFEV